MKMLLSEAFKRILASCESLDVVTFFFEIGFESVTNNGFIIKDENSYLICHGGFTLQKHVSTEQVIQHRMNISTSHAIQ